MKHTGWNILNAETAVNHIGWNILNAVRKTRDYRVHQSSFAITLEATVPRTRWVVEFACRIWKTLGELKEPWTPKFNFFRPSFTTSLHDSVPFPLWVSLNLLHFPFQFIDFLGWSICFKRICFCLVFLIHTFRNVINDYSFKANPFFKKDASLSSKDHALSRVVFVVFLSSHALSLFCLVLFWFFFFFTQCVSQLFPVALQFEDGTHSKRRQIPLLDVRWGCQSHYCKHVTTSKNTWFQ
jgi:hypothetical protein